MMCAALLVNVRRHVCRSPLVNVRRHVCRYLSNCTPSFVNRAAASYNNFAVEFSASCFVGRDESGGERRDLYIRNEDVLEIDRQTLGLRYTYTKSEPCSEA